MFIQLLEKETHKETDNDSVEGIIYSQNEAVIMTGKFVEEREVEQDKINRYRPPPSMPFFCKSSRNPFHDK